MEVRPLVGIGKRSQKIVKVKICKRSFGLSGWNVSKWNNYENALRPGLGHLYLWLISDRFKRKFINKKQVGD